MEAYQHLSHTKWQCKYRVVFIPKHRRKTLFGVVRKELGPLFRRLAEPKECRVEEGHIMADHVHMLLSMPPKLAVASVVGYIKGKSAIHVSRHVLDIKRRFCRAATRRSGVHGGAGHGNPPPLHSAAGSRGPATWTNSSGPSTRRTSKRTKH